MTARVRKMRLSWVLDSIGEQAGLTYGLGQPAAEATPRPWEKASIVYIVPKPELRVSSGK